MHSEIEAASVILRPAWRAFFLHFLAILVFVLGPMLNPHALLTPLMGQIMAAVLLMFILLRHFATRYVLTYEHLSVKGPGRRIDLELQQISRVVLRQGAIKKTLGYGNLLVYHQQKFDNPLILYGILSPEQVRLYLLRSGCIY